MRGSTSGGSGEVSSLTITYFLGEKFGKFFISQNWGKKKTKKKKKKTTLDGTMNNGQVTWMQEEFDS